ncbi:hypothetical protein AB0758_43785 [Tolypothrix bouteillei VB521301_2]|uniref:hypothetical protein n=1 Tax=Tolypothrix bouteillei TaxID=1246981 RepID=UPI0038B60647
MQLSNRVNYAIGINREIGDKVAIDFATGFYEVFADLQDVESALSNCSSTH